MNDINPHKGTATNAMCLFLRSTPVDWHFFHGYHRFASPVWIGDPAAIFQRHSLLRVVDMVGILLPRDCLDSFPLGARCGLHHPYTPNRTVVWVVVPLLVFGLCFVALVVTVYSLGEVASVDHAHPHFRYDSRWCGSRCTVYESFIKGAKEGFNWV